MLRQAWRLTQREQTTVKLNRYKREFSAALAYAVLLIAVGLVAPSFFTGTNLRDLALNNAPVLLISIGMTLVILVGQIDISVGSQFAVASVAAGALAKAGVPILLLLPCLCLIGAAMGAVNGALVGWLRLPSIIVTLAMLVAWRDALRWTTGGEWVQNLPANFQWFGFGQGFDQFRAIVVRAGTDPARVKVLSDSLEKVAGSPEYRQFLKDAGAAQDSYVPAKDVAGFLQSRLEALKRVVDELPLHARPLYDEGQREVYVQQF